MNRSRNEQGLETIRMFLHIYLSVNTSLVRVLNSSTGSEFQITGLGYRGTMEKKLGSTVRKKEEGEPSHTTHTTRVQPCLGRSLLRLNSPFYPLCTSELNPSAVQHKLGQNHARREAPTTAYTSPAATTASPEPGGGSPWWRAPIPGRRIQLP